MSEEGNFNEHAKRAIEALGGATSATDKIQEEANKIGTGMKISRVTIQKWKNNGIPAKWVPIVAKLSGLCGRKVNPDIHPQE